MATTAIYSPTGERVTIAGLANAGQLRPGDSGSGMRLYRVSFSDGTQGQASRGELTDVRHEEG